MRESGLRPILWSIVLLISSGVQAQNDDTNASGPQPSPSVEGGLSPGETEPAAPDAVLRSAVRSSPFRKPRPTAGFSAAEKDWIADNCQFGMPKPIEGADLGSIRIVVREGYVLGHSPLSKIPYWVCEHSESSELSGPGDRRKSRFLPDLKLAAQPRAELQDYRGSGYDRGHMHPAGNAKKTQQMMDETHFLSNMIPQYGPTFNQGIWARLEDTVRDWARARGECWIISGPMFYDPLEESDATADGVIPYFTIGEGEVAVPTHCYKVVLAKDDEGDWEAIAFVFGNHRHGSPYKLALHRTTIDWVEERTGLDFLPDLADDVSTAGLARLNRLEGAMAELWGTE